MTIEERFETLEKEVRMLREQKGKLRRLSLASIALALAAFIGGTALSVRAWTAAIEPDSITTKSIVIKSPNSNRAVMALNGNGTFTMFDANSAGRVVLTGSGKVTIFDPYGRPRVLMNSDGGLSVAGEAASNAVSLSPGNLVIWDSGIQRANISSAGVALRDANGKLRSSLDSGGHVQAHDPNGKVRVMLSGNQAQLYFLTAAGAFVKTLP